jgi:hypothetical protein
MGDPKIPVPDNSASGNSVEQSPVPEVLLEDAQEYFGGLIETANDPNVTTVEDPEGYFGRYLELIRAGDYFSTEQGRSVYDFLEAAGGKYEEMQSYVDSDVKGEDGYAETAAQVNRMLTVIREESLPQNATDFFEDLKMRGADEGVVTPDSFEAEFDRIKDLILARDFDNNNTGMAPRKFLEGAYDKYEHMAEALEGDPAARADYLKRAKEAKVLLDSMPEALPVL